MWQVTADQRVLFLLACCGIFVDVHLACYGNGLGNCTFQNGDTCSWRVYSGWVLHHWAGNWYLVLADYKTHARLQSRRACSTQNAGHCLTFRYYFEVDYVFELNVFLQQNGDKKDLVWKVNSSSDKTWDYAKVPIKTNKNFSVTIQVDRLYSKDYDEDSVYIDTIRYWKSSCTIQPSTARPATTTPTTKSTTTILPTTVTITTTTNTRMETTTKGLKQTPPTTTATPTQSAASNEGLVGSVESSSRIGMIVGAVVAVVIVVAIVAVLVFVFMRRKQLHFWKACLRDSKQTEDFHVTTSHNAAYSLDTGDPDGSGGVEMTPADSEQYCDSRLDTRTSILASDNLYRNIKKPDEHSSQALQVPGYSAVNKPRKVELGNLSPVHEKSDRNLYEIDDASVECPPKQAQQNDARNYGDYESVSASVSPATDNYSHLVNREVKKTEPAVGDSTGLYCNVDTANGRANHEGATTAVGQAEGYSWLDFEGKSSVEVSADDDKNKVYSHLNEGDEDAYSEVDREKRREVIDGDYSHLR